MKKSMEETVVSANTGDLANKVILISQVAVLFNCISCVVAAYGKTGRDRSAFLLHQACLAPEETYSVFFLKVMPVNQIILYISDAITITGHWYLYRFLKENTDKRESENLNV